MGIFTTKVQSVITGSNITLSNRSKFFKALVGFFIFFLLGTLFSYGQVFGPGFEACANNNNSNPPYTVAQSTDPNYTVNQQGNQVPIFIELATAIIGPGDDFCIGNDPGADTEDGCGTFLFTGLDGNQGECETEICFSPRQGCGSALGNVCIFIEDPNNGGSWLNLGAPDGTIPNNQVCVYAPAGVTSFAITICRPGNGPVSINDVVVNQPPTPDLGPDRTVCTDDLPTTINLTLNEPNGQTGGSWTDSNGPIADPTAVEIDGSLGLSFTFTYTYNASGDVGYTCTVSDDIIYTITDVCCEFVATCPTNTDLGDYNCNQLGSIPAPPTSEAQAEAAPYNMTIGDIPCGVIVVQSSDDITNYDVCVSGGKTITRTVTIFDDLNADGILNGAEESQVCTFTFEILEDTEAPVLAGVPADAAASCDAVPAPASPTATDNCGTATITFAETTAAGNCAGNYILTRTWTATDECGNTTSESQTINVTDTTAPVLSGIPAEANADCESIPPAATVTATDNCSGIPLGVEFSESTTPGACAGTYTITRTWTATDECGNTTSESQTINVTDTTAPVLSGIPAEANADCESIPPAATVTATDNCSGIPLGVEFSESTTPGACAGTYTITRTWTATDECGNTTSESQTINVTDTTAPVLSGIPAEANADCESIPPAATVTATDNCSGIPLGVEFSESTTPGACAGTYTITRTWTATDECGNTTSESQTINVTDTTAPVLSGIPAEANADCESIPPAATVTATDNCSGIPLGVEFSESTTPGACAGTYTITRTWTATDECGNTTSESQTINVTDTTAPVLSGIPAEANADCESIPPAATVTATDNCSGIPLGVEFSESTTPGACAGTYTITRTWTATDECGNTTSESQTINVTDTTAPVLSGIPAEANADCESIPPAATVTATDNCSGIPLGVEFSESTTPGACAGTYTITRTWTATDECGNTTSESQTINVTDTTAPVLSGIPAEANADCESIPPAATVTATDNCSGIPLGVEFSESTTPGACAGTYTITRTWTATDECGNTTSESQTINVTDTTAPVLSGIPAEANADCESIPPAATVTATDNCSGIPLGVEFSESTTPGACAGTYTITRTWTATDECGNTTSESQTINVTDTTAPVLSGIPAEANADCESIPPAATVTATDNCSGIPLGVEFSESTTPGACAGTYTITRTWTATDECGNTTSESQTINVTDTTAPVLSGIPAEANADCESIPPAATVTATDNCSGIPLGVEFSESTTPGACAGTYTITRTWTATDECGNTTSESQTINVTDTTAPVLSGIPAEANADCESIPPAATVTATDNCSGIPLGVEFSESTTPGACAGTYTITRTWTATDECGNTTSESQTINVTDTTAPVLSGIPAEANADCESIPPAATVTATDNCSGIPLGVEFSESTTPGACAGTYTITRTWTATDECGNTTSESQTINVTDTTAPVLSGIPAEANADCESIPPAATVTATDNCSGIPLGVEFSESTTPGACAGTYTITRTWTATDECGNTTSESQTINVTDTTAPVLSGIPAEANADCESIPPAATVTATDNCSGIPLGVEFSESTTPGACAGTYTITRTWTATDECGNTTSESQTINVTDTTAPVLSGIPAEANADCESIPPAATVTATDNCSGIPLGVEFSESTTPGACAGTYTITRTWTATDECGNTTSESQTINVTDTTAPVLSGIPAEANADCESIPPAATVTATDNCSGIPLGVEFSESTTPGACAGTYTITRTWTATDECGNTTSESQTINVTDTTAPVLSGIPAEANADCESIPPAATVTATDNCSGIPLGVEFSESTTPGACAGTYTITRTWTATDECGNTTSESQTINVTDTTAPVLSGIPAEANADCESIPPAATVTATDNCSGIPLGVEFSESTTPGACAGTYTITRTWTATDECGNTTSESQTINVTDTTAPVLSGIPAEANADCESIPPAATVTATDNCSGIPLGVEFSESTTPGACAGTYTITRTWTATDECGNTTSESQTINVTDTTAPVLSGIPAEANADCESIPPAATVTATDNCSGIPLGVEFSESTTPGACAGTYTITRTWTATDECGNTTSESQTINVTDTTAPVLSGIPAEANADCESIPPAATVTATDNCSGIPLGVEFSESTTPGACAGTYTITRTWTATDECGNTTSESQTINVTDTTAPVLSGIPAEANADCESIPPAATVTATDNCSGIPLGVEFSESTTPGACAGTYTITRTWTATDECGNTTSESQTINVTDTTAPVLSGIPAEANADCESIPPAATVTATDNCSGIPLGVEFSESTTPGACAGTYTITRTWTATDECGNTTSESQTINVTDTTAPVLSGIPAEANADCESIPPAATVTATDNCSGIPLGVEFSESTTPGACAGTYTITRTWTATDECGNTTSESQTINVTDTTAPVLSGIPAEANADCESIPPAATVTATDNCSGIPLGVEFSESTTPGACAGTYTITRTWTATDECGNTTSESQTINVTDTTAPVLSGIPAEANADCESIPPAATVTATDNCSGIPLGVEFSESTTPGACAGTYTITRTWTATDECGNTTSESQTINVTDTTAPVLSGIPAEANADCESIPPAATVTATDNCSGIPLGVEFSESTTPGACAGTYTITRTWTATDECGNTTSESQTINVTDTTAPVLSGIPAEANADCESIPPAATVTATDNCSGIPLGVEFSESTTPGACAGTYTITRTWTATDECGNTTSESQTINVTDTTAPVLSGIPAEANADCKSIPPAATVTATDNCSGIPLGVEFSESTTPGACAGTYTITRTWTATDECGNTTSESQTINVTDTTAPVLSGIPAEANADCESIPPAATVTATDNCSGIPLGVEFSESTTPGACAGTYTITRTWTATDECGNTTSESQTINVTDTTAPVLSGIPAEANADCESIPPAATVTATDNCSGIPLGVEFSESTTPGACAGTYTITRTWTATDECGNTTSESQTINVTDTTAPVLSGIPAEANADCESIPPAATVTATDNCSGIPLGVEFSESTTPGACAGTYTITRTWTATDECGNTTSESQTINVTDTTAPAISCPADITIECTASTDPVNTGQATATDNCDANPTVTYTDSGTGSCYTGEYVITRTWTATDDCGNKVSCTQLITIAPATVSGHLYVDINGNGTQDTGELGLANIDVVITDSQGNTQTVTTDANGNYSATVPAGTTTADVDETDPDYPTGYTQTEGDDPTTITAIFNQNNDIGTDGYFLPGSLNGHLYVDTNGNGTQDLGEPDLTDVDLLITDANGNTQTVTTDANGDWIANNLPPGTTSSDVDESDPDYPTGYTQTEGDDPTSTIVVAGDNTFVGNDGYDPASDVSGHLYVDTNGNGTQDAGEPDLANVDVIVTDASGIPQTVTTDANGDWTAVVLPGTVTADVDETDPQYPTGYTQTEGDDPTTVTAVENVDTDAGNDGYDPAADVSGHLYVDTNGNGTQDAGEPDLANVDVIVTDASGIPQTVTTDANGDWTAVVLPGTVTADVDETDPQYPTGYTQTEGDDPTTVTAVENVDTDAGNDGYDPAADVSGHLYVDTNGNGTQDAGELDLANVDVIVTDASGIPQTVTTDANGDWTAVVLPGTVTADVDETDPDYPTDYTQTEGNDPTTVTAVENVDTDAGNDGYDPAADVSGHLYVDTNGNGTQDAGEPDLANVDVIVTDASGIPQTVTTDANGDWTAVVLPGTVTADVDETDPQYPTGYTQTEGDDPTTVTAVENVDTDAGNDGYDPAADVSGHLYVDTNGNGTQDAGEPDLANVDVIVTDASGIPQTVTTDANGDWTAVVLPGSVTVDVDETDPQYPTGYTQTEGDDPTTVTAVENLDTDAGNDGYDPAADVSGHLYVDTNGNGTQDAGEPDLANVDIIVTDASGIPQTVTTDANGDWTAVVLPGTVTADVDETDPQYPTGYTQTEGDDPTTVTAVENVDTDAGNDGYDPAADVSGHLYVDTNGNGTQDAGEPDLANVDVIVTDASGIPQTVTTDANGDWTAVVLPGSVTVDVDETDPQYPTGYTQTEGDDPTTVTAVENLDTDAGNDGYDPAADVSGHLYVDTNGNGTQDAGEPDLANVDIIVTDASGIPQTVTTDANGDWTAVVLPGTVTADVDETDPQYPTGYTQTEGDDPTTVTAVENVDTDAGNDGYDPAADVSGHLYVDTNGNGTQDAGEPDLANVDVIVTDASGIPQTVTTDANGDWTAVVLPGTVTADVDETDPDYPTDYTQTEGNDPTVVTAVENVDTDAGNDGYDPAADVSGHLYVDTNGNRTQDAGEPDLANVDVIVTDASGIPQTVTTDANGDWTAVVLPGTVTADVDETDPQYPTGYTQTEGDDPTTVTAVENVDTDAGNDGYDPAADVSGHLYVDTNGNGTQDAGEPDLANVDVIVTDASGIPQTVTTDANGDWTAVVLPGTVTADVDETDPQYPTGYTQTEGDDPTTVTAVENVDTDAGNDGYDPAADVSGHLYVDTNGNGTQDAGEPDLANVDVIVTDASGIPQTVTTDANGDWTAIVLPGSVTVDVDETDPQYPTGYTQTEGDDPTTVTAVENLDTDAGNDGYDPAADVSGHLYVDTNGNGTQDAGEPDLANVDIIVTDASGIPQTVTTDANGDWTAVVLPGTVTADVDETDPQYPTGYTQTEGDDPTTVTAVENVDTDAGNDGYDPAADVSGHLYVDTNGNGTQDAGEPDLANVDVIVTDASGIPQTVTTDANGDWTAVVLPGTVTADVDDETLPTGSPLAVLVQTEGDDPTTVTALINTNNDGGTDGYNRQADVSIVKTDNGSDAVAGEQYEYTLTVSNSGPWDANGIVVVDNLPEGMSFVSAIGANFTVADQVVTSDPLDIIVGGPDVVITITVDVASSVDNGTLINTATAIGIETDPDPTNNEDNESTDVVREADLSISKDDGVTQMTAGDGVTYTYTITVNNAGPSDADLVSVSDTWPAGFTQGTVTPSQGTTTAAGSDFTWSAGTIVSDGSATLTVSYTVPSDTQAGPQTNTVTVTSDEPDPNPSNNTDEDTNEVFTSSDLSISKDDGVTQVTAGDGVMYTYTITVNNAGPSDADLVSVSDSWPAGFTQGTVTPSQGTTTAAGSDFTWSAGTIVSGGNATLTVSYTVPSDTQAGPQTNTATVSSDEPDPDPNNNTDEDTNKVLTSSDLRINKDDGVAEVTAGDGVTYEYNITVNNDGPSDADNVIVEDVFPTGFSMGTVSSSQGGCTGFGCNLGTIASGESATITVQYTVPSDTQAGPQKNTATVTSDEPDPDPNNNTDDDTNEVLTKINLSIVKTFDPTEVPQGTFQTFTIEVSNAGPSDAVDVSVTDFVDTSLNVQSVSVTSGSGDCSASAGQEVDCTVQIPTGDSVTVTVDYLTAPFFDGTSTPYGTGIGDDFYFVFVNGSVLEGSTDGGPVLLDGVDITADVTIVTSLTRNDIVFDPDGDGPEPAFELHLSCSDPFTGGWGQSGGPTQDVDGDGWQIAYFSIGRYSPQGFLKSCGNVTNPFDIVNTADTTGEDSFGTETATDDATVTIGPGITLDRLQTNGKRLTARLNNLTGDEKIIDEISVVWPESNGNLTKVWLTFDRTSDIIWQGSDNPADALLDANDPGWIGGSTLLTGEAILRFDFKNKVANVGYTIRVHFTDFTWLDINVPSETTRVASLNVDATATMTVYPNPVTTSFNVKLDGYTGEYAEIAIFDLKGRQLLNVKKRHVPGKAFTIDLPAWIDEGYYYVRLNNSRSVKAIPILISR